MLSVVYAECGIKPIMLNVVMLVVVMLDVIMLVVVMLNVVVLLWACQLNLALLFVQFLL